MLSIIIVTWNSGECLKRCIESLNTSDFRDKSVIVIDNASTDGSIKDLKRLFPEIELIENPENIGFAKAVNRALDKCTGKYILLLNPDAFLQQDTLSVLVRFMEDHSDAGICGPVLLNEEGNITISCSYFPTLLRQFVRFSMLYKIIPDIISKRFKVTAQKLASDFSANWIIGAVMLIRKSALDDIGKLDESNFLYGEDLDICYRFKQKGWKVFVVAEAKAVHIGRKSTDKMWGDEKNLFPDIVLCKFFKRHKGPTAFYILRLIQILGAALRIIYWKITGFIKPSLHDLSSGKIAFHKNYLWGVGGMEIRKND